jgi:hypothetical protein
MLDIISVVSASAKRFILAKSRIFVESYFRTIRRIGITSYVRATCKGFLLITGIGFDCAAWEAAKAYLPARFFCQAG